jgi:hypothetical protein
MVSRPVKLPAYGRALMNRRYAGWHPLYVRVIYGEDWELIRDDWFTDIHAYVAVRPSDYQPGRFDWRCAAGSAVTVFDQAKAAGEIGLDNGAEEGWGKFYYLLRELSQMCGPLEFLTAARIYGEADRRPIYYVPAPIFAFECRTRPRGPSRPWWWPESMDLMHAEKIHAWGHAVKQRAPAIQRFRGRT